MPSIADRVVRPLHGLAIVVVVALGVELLTAVVAGSAQAFAGDGFPGTKDLVAETLLTFGAAGSFVDVILAVACIALAALTRPSPNALRRVSVTIVGLVGLAVLAAGIGGVMIGTNYLGAATTANVSRPIGQSLAELVLLLGGAAVVGQLQPLTPAGADEDGAGLFAVDRVNGEVFAFFSRAEAVRTLSVFAIEDGEFDFYAWDGRVVQAEVQDLQARFAVTDDDARSALLTILRQFTTARGIATTGNEPADFVAGVRSWQWLQLWPPWMRPLARLVRAVTGAK
jgi:hypothetical protein